jgi:hypothetical protein
MGVTMTDARIPYTLSRPAVPDSMFGFTAALARLANVVLVFGNGDNGFYRGLNIFRQVAGLQALCFFNNRLEGVGNIISTHAFFLLRGLMVRPAGDRIGGTDPIAPSHDVSEKVRRHHGLRPPCHTF